MPKSMSHQTSLSPHKRVPLGQAIIWTEKEINRMCRVTEHDAYLAQLWWRHHTLPKYRRLLDAVNLE